MNESVEHIIDRSLYEILNERSPDLIQIVGELLELGQTPAEIEETLIQRFGRCTTTLHVRAAAEHMKRIKTP